MFDFLRVACGFVVAPLGRKVFLCKLNISLLCFYKCLQMLPIIVENFYNWFYHQQKEDIYWVIKAFVFPMEAVCWFHDE